MSGFQIYLCQELWPGNNENDTLTANIVIQDIVTSYSVGILNKVQYHQTCAQYIAQLQFNTEILSHVTKVSDKIISTGINQQVLYSHP